MAKTLPRNAEIADQLDLLADISEILGEESFRVIAYRRAATRIRETPGPVAELALSGRATDLPGIGKTIEQKVVEIVNDGEMHALTRRRQSVPEGVVEFLRLPGVGPKTAARIWTELGVTTLEGLQSRRRGRAAARPLRPRREERGEGAEGARGRRWAGGAAENRGLLGTALPAVARSSRSSPRTPRRSRSPRPAACAAARDGARPRLHRDLFRRAGAHRRVLRGGVGRGGRRARRHEGDRRRHQGLRFDLRVVPPECYGNVLQHFTGSKDHNVALREEALAARALDLRVRGHDRRDR